jgi:hypothetical protein
MIVYHGTTADCRAGIEAEGLRPGSFVAPSRDLASDYSWRRAMDLGADSCVLFELDVPDAAVVTATSWWWAPNQMQLPYGCPPSCILSIDTSDPPRFSMTEDHQDGAGIPGDGFQGPSVPPVPPSAG